MGLNAKQLICATALAIAGIGTGGVSLDRALRYAPEQGFAARLLARPAASVIAIGDSTIQAGFDDASFVSEWHPSDESSPKQVFNAGLGGTGLTQRYVTWRLASENRTDIKHLIIGAFDHKLTSPSLMPWNTWFGNDAMAFYADPSWSEPYACKGVFDRLCYRAARHFPLFTERGGMWAKIEQTRRFLGALGMERQATNRFGRLSDMNSVLEQDHDVFMTRTRKALEEQAPLAPQIADMLAEAHGKGVETTVVMMPLPSRRHAFYATVEWKNYLQHVRTLLQSQGARLIDATTWVIGENDFVDQLHLSQPGASSFSKRLAHEMRAQ